MAELAAETENDSVCLPHRVIYTSQIVNPIARIYVIFIDELSVVNGVLLKSQRVVVQDSTKAKLVTHE